MFFKQSKDGIVVLEQNGKVYEANRQFADMLGYYGKEIQHLHVWDWDKQFSKEEILEKLREIGSSGQNFETKQLRGEEFMILINKGFGTMTCGSTIR